MEDHHVDRPGVEAQQCVKLTGTNSSIGLIPSRKTIARSGNARLRNTISTCVQNTYRSAAITYAPISRLTGDTGAGMHESNHAPCPFVFCVHRRSGGHSEGPNTRSHPELGRENPPRRWYCVLRRGRVGRRQAFHERKTNPKPNMKTNSAYTHNNQPIRNPEEIYTNLPRVKRGVEQPGSSSGS